MRLPEEVVDSVNAPIKMYWIIVRRLKDQSRCDALRPVFSYVRVDLGIFPIKIVAFLLEVLERRSDNLGAGPYPGFYLFRTQESKQSYTRGQCSKFSKFTPSKEPKMKPEGARAAKYGPSWKQMQLFGLKRLGNCGILITGT
jgi:hypothetical protein